jgi:hypothetical protein
MCLDVQNGSLAIGALMVQLWPSATDPAQSFRFEDAGNGFFYIRTLAGLYATVSEATGVASSAGGTFGLKQDRKYAAGSVGANNPDLQRWKFASSSITVINADNYAISCAAIPGKVLQPAGGSTASGAARKSMKLRGRFSRRRLAQPWSFKWRSLASGGSMLIRRANTSGRSLLRRGLKVDCLYHCSDDT